MLHIYYIEGKKELITYVIYSPEMYIIWKEFLRHSKNGLMARWAYNVVLITDFELKQNFLQIKTMANRTK